MILDNMADPDFGKNVSWEDFDLDLNTIDDKIVRKTSRFLGKKYNTSQVNSNSDTCPINFTLQTLFLLPQRERGGKFGN